MSDDLISRKALLEEIRNFRCSITGLRAGKEVLARAADEYRKSMLQIIEDQPTAFDKEKVKEQIQIFRSKFECTCCPKNIGKHIPVSCDECMDTFAKANIVIVEKGGIK